MCFFVFLKAFPILFHDCFLAWCYNEVLIRDSSSYDIRRKRCCFFACYVSFLVTLNTLVGRDPDDDYVFVIIRKIMLNV